MWARRFAGGAPSQGSAGPLSPAGLPVATLLLVAFALGACSHKAVGPDSLTSPGPWEHAFVELADRGPSGPLRMHYLAAGPKNAPRVVLLHGFPDLSYGWRDVLPALAADHRVLAPDLRGYGGTDKPETGYDIHEVAADIAAFIAATAVADGLPLDSPVHLIGHDWGAATGWWVAMDHPATVLSYTAISVPHPAAWRQFLAEDKPQRKRAVYQKQLAVPGVPGLLAGFSRKQLGGLYRGDLVDPSVFTDEHLAIYWSTWLSADDWRPPLAYYRALWTDPAEAERRERAAAPVSVPTLVLWGQQDGFLYARQAERSCAFVAPGPCEVTVFPDAGHFVQWDAPDALVARWREFRAKLPGR
jgi:pimeloyl-ACP methyl ester carboxylesterase